MQKDLARAGTNVPATATYIDVVVLYKYSKESGALLLPSIYNSVEFPLESPSIFYVSQNKLKDVTEPKIMDDINHQQYHYVRITATTTTTITTTTMVLLLE